MKRVYFVIGLLIALAACNSSSSGGGASPVITSVTPATGPRFGRTQLTIKGKGFAAGASTTIGGFPVFSTTFIDSTTLIVRSQSGTPGIKDVDVTLPGGAVLTAFGAFEHIDTFRTTDQTPETGAEYGWSVATGDISGDGIPDLAVGAPSSDVGASIDAGEVIIHILDGVGGFSAGTVTKSETTIEANAKFGRNIVIANVIGSSIPDLIVSSERASSGGQVNAGEVWVYESTGSGFFNPEVIISDPTNEVGGNFGEAIAVGDLDNDGLDDLAISAVGAPSGNDRGEVWVFLSTGSGFNNQPVIIDPTPENNAEFGYSLAIADVISDANQDLIVGARDATAGGQSGAGKVIVFPGNGSGSFGIHTTLQEPTPQPGADFGSTVAVGDMSGDGRADIAVGAPGANAGVALNAGEVFIYMADGAGGLAAPIPVTWGSPESGDAFGTKLCVDDFTGDEISDLVIGMPNDDSNYGTTALLEADKSGGFYPVDGLSKPPIEPGAMFGISVAVSDVTDDGLPEVIVGASGSSIAGPSGSGEVVVHSTGP